MNYKDKRLISKNHTLDKYLKPKIKSQADQASYPSIKKVKIPPSSGLPGSTLPINVPLKYPKNPEVREYQQQIVKDCICFNTLVCLPTGLGKTHIAAILMANFTNWFPEQKILFLAPTKPLVNQQTSALKSLQQLVPKTTIVQVTGKILPCHRQELYKNHKIIFATPKTIQNDIKDERLKRKDIIMIIFDQCHRSTGNSPYALIMKLMNTSQAGFRVIGLSATPGYEFDKVQEVIQNLNISKMIYKDENDPDVKKYLHQKHKMQIIIPQTQIIRESLRYIDKFAIKSLGILSQLKLIEPWVIRRGLSATSFFMIRERFNKNIINLENKHKFLAYMALNLVCFLSRCRKALLQNGYLTFKLMFFKELKENHQRKDDKIDYTSKISQVNDSEMDNTEYLDDIYAFYSEFSNKGKDQLDNKSILKSCSPLVKKCILETEEYKKLQNMFVGRQSEQMHPKMTKTAQVLSNFFKEHTGKAIVFTQYKITAKQIKDYLKGIQSIKAELFFGQSKTTIIQKNEQYSLHLNQKDQLAVIERYKRGEINVLISTCIGEEGLDIGEVDCIVCYDGGHSPIRAIQRSGRTGRKRDGYVYILLMEGRQAQDYENGKKKSVKMKKMLRKNEKLKYYSYNSSLFDEIKYIPVQYFDNQLIYAQSTKKQIKKTKKNKKIQSSDNQNSQSNEINKFQTKQTKKKKRNSKKQQKLIEQQQLFQNEQSKNEFSTNLLKRSSISNILQKYKKNETISSQTNQNQQILSQQQTHTNYPYIDDEISMYTYQDFDQISKNTMNESLEESCEESEETSYLAQKVYKDEDSLFNMEELEKQSQDLIFQFMSLKKQYRKEQEEMIQKVIQWQAQLKIMNIEVIKEEIQQNFMTQELCIEQNERVLAEKQEKSLEQLIYDDNKSDLSNHKSSLDSQQQLEMIMTTLNNFKNSQRKRQPLINYESLLQQL